MAPPAAEASLGSSPAPPQVTLRLTTALALVLVEALAFARPVHPLGPVIALPVIFIGSLLAHTHHKLTSLPSARPMEHALAAGPALTHSGLLILCTAGEAFALHTHPHIASLVFPWLAALILPLLAVSATLAFVPAPTLRRLAPTLLRATPAAAAVTALAAAAQSLLSFLWSAPDSSLGRTLQTATLNTAAALLRCFYPFIYTRAADHVLATRGFGVRITASCSGIESLGLMLVFSIAAVLYLRHDIRLSRALWFVPAGLAATWLLNIVRIATLIALGDHGHPHFALTLFHSHAGWLLFNAAAVSFLYLLVRLPWLQRAQN